MPPQQNPWVPQASSRLLRVETLRDDDSVEQTV